MPQHLQHLVWRRLGRCRNAAWRPAFTEALTVYGLIVALAFLRTLLFNSKRQNEFFRLDIFFFFIHWY